MQRVIEFDGSKAGMLIGPKGSTISDLQARSGAAVKIDTKSSPATATLSGKASQVAAAAELISGLLNPPFVELRTDHKRARHVIGQGGSTIKRLQEESGSARIKVDIDEAQGSATITIQGSVQADVDKAASLVSALINPLSVELTTDESHASAVIGQRGNTIKRLQQESGSARINVDIHKGTGKATISIEAQTQADLDKATSLVSNIINPPCVELTTDETHAKMLVGPGGSAIKQLQVECGSARIKVDIPQGTGQAHIRIEASTAADLRRAEGRVRAVISPGFTEIACTPVQLSHVIGPQGGAIKALQASTGATILTQEADTKHSVVRIEGTVQQIAAASEAVRVILDEQAHPDYAGAEGTRLRGVAEQCAQERTRLHGEADVAFGEGDKQRGYELMEQAKHQGLLLHQANEAAAAAILEHRNSGHGAGTLDLHGLHVDEALRATQARLELLTRKGAGGVFEVIPGAGHHSSGGKAAIKPAVEKLLKQRGLSYTVKHESTFIIQMP